MDFDFMTFLKAATEVYFPVLVAAWALYELHLLYTRKVSDEEKQILEALQKIQEMLYQNAQIQAEILKTLTILENLNLYWRNNDNEKEK